MSDRYDPFLDKGLPSNIEAERSVLGAILLDNAVFNQAIELLRHEDFFLDSHRRIYAKMVSLTERQMPIDLVTLREELECASEFELIGGATYIGSLIDGVPRTDTIEPYAKIVIEKSTRRKLLAAAERIQSIAFDESSDVDADTVVALVQAVAEEDRQQRKTIVHWPALQSITPPQQIADTVWLRGAHNTIYGPSETAKTLRVLRDAILISQNEAVIYVLSEGQGGIWPRLNAHMEHTGMEPGELYFCTDPVNLLDRVEVIRFLRWIDGLKLVTAPALIVFDTFSGATPDGNENAIEDMGKAFANAALIRARTGTATLFVDHSNAAGTRERGHSIKRNAVDLMIEASREDDLIVHKMSKLKDGTPWDAEYFKLLPVAGSVVLVGAKDIIPDSANLTNQQESVLQAIGLPVFQTTGCTVAQLVEVTEIPRGSVYRVVSVLTNLLLCHSQSKRKTPDRFFLTDLGCQKLVRIDPSCRIDVTRDLSTPGATCRNSDDSPNLQKTTNLPESVALSQDCRKPVADQRVALSHTLYKSVTCDNANATTTEPLQKQAASEGDPVKQRESSGVEREGNYDMDGNAWREV